MLMIILGKGSFGQVFKCVVMDDISGLGKPSDKVVAVKIIKNLPAYNNQGLMEISILEKLNASFSSEKHPLVQLLDHFVFNNHLCLVFEMLGASLFDLLKMNHYNGLDLELVRFVRRLIKRNWN